MMTYASELGVKGIVLKLIGPHIKENMIFIHMCCVAVKQLLVFDVQGTYLILSM